MFQSAPLPGLDFFNTDEVQVAMLAGNEQLLLFALVYALEPDRVLEIGFERGGSARIIWAALRALPKDSALLASIDPHPAGVPQWTNDLRFRLIGQPSPEGVPIAANFLAGPIDFCFIDANHAEDCVFADSIAVADLISRDGYILYHDGFYRDVSRGVDRFLLSRGDFVDCGMIARFRAEPSESTWGGFRLLRRSSI